MLVLVYINNVVNKYIHRLEPLDLFYIYYVDIECGFLDWNVIFI